MCGQSRRDTLDAEFAKAELLITLLGTWVRLICTGSMTGSAMGPPQQDVCSSRGVGGGSYCHRPYLLSSGILTAMSVWTQNFPSS